MAGRAAAVAQRAAEPTDMREADPRSRCQAWHTPGALTHHAFGRRGASFDVRRDGTSSARVAGSPNLQTPKMTMATSAYKDHVGWAIAALVTIGSLAACGTSAG